MGSTEWVPPNGSHWMGPTEWVPPNGSHQMGPTEWVLPNVSYRKGPTEWVPGAESYFTDMPLLSINFFHFNAIIFSISGWVRSDKY